MAMDKEKTPRKEMAVMAQEEVHAGFPSPAQGYLGNVIDLNKELVRHPQATFFARVTGDSMIDAGVEQGDVLVIDKALEPRQGDMAVCFLDGEFALKYISFVPPEKFHIARRQKASYSILPRCKLWLMPANKNYPPIEVEEGNDFTVWGVVTYIIKKTCTR